MKRQHWLTVDDEPAVVDALSCRHVYLRADTFTVHPLRAHHLPSTADGECSDVAEFHDLRERTERISPQSEVIGTILLEYSPFCPTKAVTVHRREWHTAAWIGCTCCGVDSNNSNITNSINNISNNNNSMNSITINNKRNRKRRRRQRTRKGSENTRKDSESTMKGSENTGKGSENS